MASFKILSILALVITISTASVDIDSSSLEYNDVYLGRAVKKSNSLIVGVREYGDTPIYQEKIAEKYLISGKKLILNRNITAQPNYYITQVACIDQATDGTGAEVTITGGGSKSTFVSLRFKSQRWHGIYFNVTVYAKRRY